MAIKDEVAVESDSQSGGITAGKIHADVINHNITNIHYGTLPTEILLEAEGIIAKEGEEREYKILLCPCSESDLNILNVYKELKGELIKQGFILYESSPEFYEDSSYWHLDEANFIVNKNCSSIIIFLGDNKTLSQLSLFTFLLSHKDMKLNELDICIISIADTNERYFMDGCLLYANDNIPKRYDIKYLQDNGVQEIVTYLVRKRSVYNNSGRGKRKLK